MARIFRFSYGVHLGYLALGLLAAAIVFSTIRSLAQTTNSGSVSGVVSDPSGAVVVDAKVELKSNERGTMFLKATNSEGVYNFVLLEPGLYKLTVQAPGFDKVEREVRITVSQAVSVNFRIGVATSRESVAVSGVAPMVQADNGNVATTMGNLQISQVPNPGNDLTNVAQLAPGSVMNTASGYGNFSSFGMPALSNLFTLNGMDDNDPFLHTNNSGPTNMLLGLNEIQETTVVANDYTGQYGELAGANVTFITKSGSNLFHGNALYYWNGAALNAESWLDKFYQLPKPFANANEWAASLGGPIMKEKLFFFLNTEGVRVLLPQGPDLVNVPSPQFEADALANLTIGMNGVPGLGLSSASTNFYKTMFNFYNHAPGIQRAVGGQSGGTDSIGCQSPNLPPYTTPFYLGDPALGTPGHPCVLNFANNPVALTTEWQLSGRVDYNLSSKDQMFLHIEHDDGVQASYTDPISSVFNLRVPEPAYQGQFLETHTFGATATNQFLVAASWASYVFKAQAAASIFPMTMFVGDSAISPLGMDNSVFPQGRAITEVQLQDDFSKTVGVHTLKLGAKWTRTDVSDYDFGLYSHGLLVPFTIADFFSGGIALGSVGPAGFGDELVQAFPASLSQPIAIYTLQGYAQDQWRVKPNLTLTMALRVEHFSNPVCQDNCFADTSAQWGQLDHNLAMPYNQAISTGRHQAVPSLQAVQLEPRFGFAWQPFVHSGNHWSQNFVVRGGIGLFADQLQGSLADSAAQNPPLYNTFTVSPFAGVSINGVPYLGNWMAPGETNQSRTPNGNIFADAASFNTAFLSAFRGGQTLSEIQAAVPFFQPPAITTFERQLSYPVYEKWSLEVQNTLGANSSIHLTYVGNHGYHETIEDAGVNAYCSPSPSGFGLPPTVCQNGAFADIPQNAPPDPRFAGVTWIRQPGVSNYNGLTTSFQHRFRGLAEGVLQFNYTWSHTFDEVSNGGLYAFNLGKGSGVGASIGPQDPFNFRANYGPADYDVRHYINANYVYQLPVRQLLRKRGSEYLTNTWQASGTVFFRTGLPYSVFDAEATAGLTNYTLAYILPQFLGGAVPNCGEGAAGAATQPCLNASMFQKPLTETGFTTGLRNRFYGPGFFDTDFTLMKNTKLPGWEKATLGIGFQFFNLFNHPNFNNPASDVSSSGTFAFGHIYSQANPPTSILGSFLGADASPRLIQLKGQLVF